MPGFLHDMPTILRIGIIRVILMAQTVIYAKGGSLVKKIFVQKIQQLSRVVAPLTLALAIVTANSTCWWFTYQPNVPEGMKRYIK